MVTKKKDISNTVVAVVLVIAVLASVAGTWLFLGEISGEHTMQITNQPAKGNVKLEITNPITQTSSSGGNVGLTILK